MSLERLAQLDPEEFMAETRATMAEYEISARRLAMKAGIQAQHMSKYMQGKVEPSLRTMVRIYEALTALIDEEWEKRGHE